MQNNLINQASISLDLVILVVVGLLIYTFLFLRKRGKEAAATLGVAASSETVEKASAKDAVSGKNAKVAAAMAAIQVMMGETKYRVISVKTVSSSSWKQAVDYQQDFVGGRK